MIPRVVENRVQTLALLILAISEEKCDPNSCREHIPDISTADTSGQRGKV